MHLYPEMGCHPSVSKEAASSSAGEVLTPLMDASLKQVLRVLAGTHRPVLLRQLLCGLVYLHSHFTIHHDQVRQMIRGMAECKVPITFNYSDSQSTPSSSEPHEARAAANPEEVTNGFRKVHPMVFLWSGSHLRISEEVWSSSYRRCPCFF